MDAWEAIVNDHGPAGEWANQVDVRQIQRAWEHAGGFKPKGDKGELDVTRVADVEMAEVDWLWPLRLARGKVTIVSGDPGLGKSQIATDITARISIGDRWPDGGHAPLGSVVMLAAEDAVNDTIRPRLEAAGADVGRVHVVKMVVTDGEGRRTFNLGTDLEKLEGLVNEIADTALVIVDPISAYIGDSKDSHKLTVISPLLSQLADFAERTGTAVVAIHHPPKDAPHKAIHAFSGSLAFVAGPRLAFIVTDDADTESERKLLLPVKNNLGPKAGGLGYRIVDTAIDHRIRTSVLRWDDEPVTVSAGEALRQSDGHVSKLEPAKEFLQQRLADGPVPSTDLFEAAKRLGIGKETLKTAKEKLGVTANKIGFTGGWEWRLPRSATLRSRA
jgi:putative DNA primase/helicase